MPAVENNYILGAKKTVFVVHVILAFGVVRITSEKYCKRETWMKPNSVDFSNLTLWQELSSDSEFDCIRKCYHAYCSGCGYQTDEQKCFLYLDWKNVTPWTPLLTVDYYVPASSIVLEGWSDLRKYGQSFAMLIINTSSSWSKANTFCINKGGTLLIMNTIERKQAVLEEFKRQGITTGRFWLGLTDQKVEGEWYWLDGSPGQSPDFFKSNQPDNMLGNEDCGELVVQPGGFGIHINDRKCVAKLKSICELPLVL